MRTLAFLFPLLCIVFFSCDESDESILIEQGDFPLKEYYLERSPSVNPWGVEMDFSHLESTFETTSLDYTYLSQTDTFQADVLFYIANAYYTNTSGDLVSEGCPALFISSEALGCEVGIGTAAFDSLTSITDYEIDMLAKDHSIDISVCIDDSTGFYDRTLLYEEYDKCIIGRSFRTRVLEIPDGSSESDLQPVYLIKTSEGAYVKFMVVQFKGDGAYKKQTQFRWQVISE